MDEIFAIWLCKVFDQSNVLNFFKYAFQFQRIIVDKFGIFYSVHGIKGLSGT